MSQKFNHNAGLKGKKLFNYTLNNSHKCLVDKVFLRIKEIICYSN